MHSALKGTKLPPGLETLGSEDQFLIHLALPSPPSLPLHAPNRWLLLAGLLGCALRLSWVLKGNCGKSGPPVDKGGGRDRGGRRHWAKIGSKGGEQEAKSTADLEGTVKNLLRDGRI